MPPAIVYIVKKAKSLVLQRMAENLFYDVPWSCRGGIMRALALRSFIIHYRQAVACPLADPRAMLHFSNLF
jgi:hypothetical protein